MNEANINGAAAVGETVQTIKCGAAVNLTSEVLEYGIAIIHPELPLFKMYLNRAPDGKIVHRFEVCKPLFPEIKKFAIQIVEGPEALPSEVADPKPAAEEAPKSTLILP